MGLAEQPLSGGVLCWPPDGAGDFAEVAWVAAEALGNGTGVRSLQVSVHRGRVSALVYATNAGYV
ncbi:MAG: hypothetical protein WCG47_25820, partial [Dermatophilaceae bacterium]